MPPALRLIHAAGWVHREISAVHILIDMNGQTKLADFEYAKRVGVQSHNDIRVVCYYLWLLCATSLI